MGEKLVRFYTQLKALLRLPLGARHLHGLARGCIIDGTGVGTTLKVSEVPIETRRKVIEAVLSFSGWGLEVGLVVGGWEKGCYCMLSTCANSTIFDEAFLF